MGSMDVVMIVVLVLVLVAAAGAACALAAAAVVRRRLSAEAADAASASPSASPSADEVMREAMATALAQLREQAASERDAAIRAALEQAAVLQREQVGATAQQLQQASSADLSAKKDVIDSRLEQVHAEMRSELAKLGQMVGALSETSAQKFGQVDQSLRSHAEITQTLAASAQTLREAIASPTARGQWGERMAEDVLRLAGFIENVNYVKQTQLEGGTGRPDFTFPLPKGHDLYMDVKFPMAGYLRYLDAGSDAERQAHRGAFLRDVRARVKELAKRDYANSGSRSSVDYVLLFLPNEQLTGFIHEHDPSLLDDAMQQRVVMCSPLTLFAFLGVIRQAFDNYMIEQTSDEILALIGTFGQQWKKYNDSLDKVKTKFDQLDRSFEELVGTRRRQLEKPLRQLDAVRRDRNLPVDGQMFALVDDTGDDLDDDTGADGGAGVRAIGA
jgi:DNA recombination protein RmuC